MKKFLSVLLALAVAFTFTFGSTMSAFAAKNSSGTFIGYTVDEAKELVTSLGATATEGVEVNYTTAIKDADGNTLNSYTIPAASVQKGIDKVYADLYDSITASTLASNTIITVEDGYITDIFGIEMKGGAADKAALKEYLEAHPDAATYEKDAWAGYQAYLTGLVDKVDTSIYSATEGSFRSVISTDTTVYETSVEAAAADIAAAKKIIADAKYAEGAYQSLYAAVFPTIVTVKEVKVDDPLTGGKVTASLEYVLTNDGLSTIEGEKNEADKLASAKSRAKADLSDSVIAYRTGDADYDKTQEDALSAYVTIKTYLIDTATSAPINVPSIESATKTNVATNDEKNYDYIALVAAGKEAEKELAQAKTEALAYGYLWDDVAAAKALQAYLVDLYSDNKASKSLDEYISEFKVVDADLLPSQKLAAKLDYSEVEAKAVSDIYGKVYNIKEVDETVFSADDYYYEAEWTEVKAAIDTYNAAVDAAKVSADIEKAEAVMKDAIKKIVKASKISDDVDDTTTYKLVEAVGAYFDMVKAAYNTSNGTTNADIYITWDGEQYAKAVYPDDVYAWAISKGAKDAKAAYALLNEAKAVVDAYKTLDTIKNEAKAVVDAIAALPDTPVLADKDAIVAAYNAYAALHADGQKYVTNTAKLNKAVIAVEKLEAKAVAEQIAKLPAEQKATAADKEAIKAAQDAYKAYTDLFKTGEAYKTIVKSQTFTARYNFENALTNIKSAEENAIIDAFNSLMLKYETNKLTADDAAAVKALQDAIDAYIAEYKEAPDSDNGWSYIEAYTAKIAAVVAAAVAEAEWTVTDVKASLFDSNRKITIWRTSKTSIRVTSVGSVADIKDHGYTVKYKFYKKNPGATSYKLIKTTTSNKYTYTNLKKGTNKFQVKVCVYDADGKLVASKWTYYRAAKIK